MNWRAFVFPLGVAMFVLGLPATVLLGRATGTLLLLTGLAAIISTVLRK